MMAEIDLNQIAEETKAVLTQYFEQVTFPKKWPVCAGMYV